MHSFTSSFKDASVRVCLVWMLLLLGLFLGADRSFAWMLETIVRKSEQRFSTLYYGDIEADVLILGNSRGVNFAYAPDVSRLTGLPAYNLSYNGMSTVVVDAVFNDYVARHKKPSLVILEVTGLFVSHDLVNDLKLYGRESERIEDLLWIHSPQTARAIEYSHTYAFNSELFLRTLFYLRGSDQTWINRRSMQVSDVAPMIGSFAPPTFAASPSNMEALQNILRVAEELDIPVRLVVSPYLPEFLREPSVIQARDRFVQDLHQNFGDRFRVMDYSTVITEVGHFADPLHLNYAGSVKLLGQMMADGVFDLE